jgi:hypothetical protein
MFYCLAKLERVYMILTSDYRDVLQNKYFRLELFLQKLFNVVEERFATC